MYLSLTKSEREPKLQEQTSNAVLPTRAQVRSAEADLRPLPCEDVSPTLNTYLELNALRFADGCITPSHLGGSDGQIPSEFARCEPSLSRQVG